MPEVMEQTRVGDVIAPAGYERDNVIIVGFQAGPVPAIVGIPSLAREGLAAVVAETALITAATHNADIAISGIRRRPRRAAAGQVAYADTTDRGIAYGDRLGAAVANINFPENN